MVKKGHKRPDPTAAKILKGSQPCRINRLEPVVPDGNPAPPAYLGTLGREYWDELALIITAMKIFTIADRHMFGMLCLAYQDWRQNPSVQRHIDNFRRLSIEFGLTPSARAGLKVTPGEKGDALERFLTKKKV